MNSIYYFTTKKFHIYKAKGTDEVVAFNMEKFIGEYGKPKSSSIYFF